MVCHLLFGGLDMVARVFALGLPLALMACAAATNSSEAPDPFEDYRPVDASTVVPAPEPGVSEKYGAEAARHGRYLVELLGCGACHTDGALIGEPNPQRLLAGSSIGIAHSNPLQVQHPGVVFASNLTPDADTGIGALSDDTLRRAIRGGVDRHGDRVLKVMPVGAYSLITESDANDIVAYLRSLAPVSHRIPDEVREGSETSEVYVHFGVYRNRVQ